MVKIIENYTLHEQIGEGEYGKVYRGVDSRNKKEVAVKVINVKKFKEFPKLEECTLNEIQVLSKIDSPHIVKFIEILKTANNFYFFYEFCNQGTLEDIIKSKGPLQEAQAMTYFSQILDAFKILSSKHIMHRDLKPSNILVSNGIIKLADFGFCKSLQSHRDLAQTMLGSPIYMAPEVLKGQIYTIKADIWSLGVVLYEMLYGFCPFEERSIARLINLLDHEEVSFNKQINNISQNFEDLIKKMLVKDHFKRISWAQIFQYKINGAYLLSYNMNSKERISLEPNSRPQSKNSDYVSPFVRGQLKEIKTFENLDNRPFSRPSFDLTQKDSNKSNSQEAPVPGMFKKKQNSQSNKQNGGNQSRIKIVRERVKKYLKISSEILNFNFCPEVSAQLCLKIYQILQKEHNKLEQILVYPTPSWFVQEKKKLSDTISIFQEECNKLTGKPISGPLITYYVKTLQTLHKDNFIANSPGREILIHCLNLLDLNENPTFTNNNQTTTKEKGNDYSLSPKERLVSDLYQKIIRNII